MVCEDGRWYAKVTNDVVKDELGYLDASSEGKRNRFNPFGEVLYGSYYVLVSI